MGKPPEGGGSLLTLTSCILALCAIGAGAQMSQEYGCPSQEKILPCRCSTRGMEFQIWCSHSELPSVLQGLKAVSHYVTRPIDELILENNNLPSLPGNVFTILPVLRLMLRNNRLERVASSWLTGLDDTLLELFVVEPDLRSLPLDCLENLQALEALTIQSKTLKRLPRFTGLAKLRYAQINSPSLHELTPLNFRDLPNLRQLHVFGSPRLTRLEAGLFRNLTNLSIVNISSTAVSWIHPRAFVNLPNLSEITLMDNDIVDSTMLGRAIVDLPNLTYANLDGNRIDRLSIGSFADATSLRRLSLARNKITVVASGAFQRLENLRILDLSHNRIRRISAEFFLQRGDKAVKRFEEIFLIDNEIRDFRELRAVLVALPGLKILDASYNYIEEIPRGALPGHPNLERLHLDHNRLSYLQADTFVAMPALRELRLRNNSLNDLLAMPFWNLPGLKGLDLSENYFRHLGPRLLANLPNLRRLDLSGNGIAMIEPESFVSVEALEHLNISGNALSTIHPLTLRHLTKLYELDVGWNRLIELIPGLPRNLEHLHLSMNRIVTLPSIESRDLSLPSLRSLDMSANGIETIVPGTLRELSSLRKLNFAYNALRLFDDGTFDGLTRLEKLDARYNRLVSLHGRSLMPLRNLMDLNVRGNRLEVIRPDLFQENLRLQRLDISRNNLAQIPHATFSSTRDLRELYASHNTLTELPVSLHGLDALEVLDLSFNKLNILSPETLSSLTSLLELRLVRNRIKELREGAFDRLPRLTFIDLENNDLRVIERNAIRSLPELQSLRLGKNRLRSIPSGAFSELPLLQSAELQENRIHEIAVNAFVNVPHLLFLNLSNNQLPEIRHVGLESLRSLEVLDLSNNRLSRVSSDSLASMEWLVELKMDNNRICSVQGSPFDDMPRLRVLSMRDNRLTTVTEKAFKRLRSNIAILDIDGNPLSCSCGMLWLRGWLKQASTDGPRCADGSLFKEIRLSRQDCQRARHTEPIYPGCQAEIIDQSSSSLSSSTTPVHDNSGPVDASPGLLNLREPDNDRVNAQNLDYLMYEDNPAGSYASPSQTSIQSSTSSVPLATSHVIPPTRSGGHVTPPPRSASQELTLSSSQTSTDDNDSDALTGKLPSRNKNSSFPPSPSSSGFTFFGVPLPSINFNLWGNTGARKNAERKNDELVKASSRPGRSRYRVFPPTEPEIHRGGFYPLPRGQGGFLPIPDPRFAQERLISRNNNNDTMGILSNVTATITRVHRIPLRRINERNSSNLEIKPGISVKSGLTMKIHTKEEKIPPTKAIPTLPIAGRLPANDNLPAAGNIPSVGKLPAIDNATKISNLPAGSPSLTDEFYDSRDIQHGDTIVDGKIITDDRTSPSSLGIIERKNHNVDESTSLVDTTRTRKIGIWEIESRLPLDKSISAEGVDNEDSDDYYQRSATSQSSSTNEESSATMRDIEISEASALSALLIPGGQISATGSSTPRSSPVGRSTIVKVASPHLSLMADDRDFVGNGDASNTTVVNLTGEQKSEISSNKSDAIVDDNPFNWYFRNYNESDIEPYVAVIYNSDGSGVARTLASSLIIFFVQFFLIV